MPPINWLLFSDLFTSPPLQLVAKMKPVLLLQLSLLLLSLVPNTNANVWTFFNPSLKQQEHININQQFLLSSSPANPPAQAPSPHHHHHHQQVHHHHHAPTPQPHLGAKPPTAMTPAPAPAHKPGKHHHHQHHHMQAPMMAPAHPPMMHHAPMTMPAMPPHSHHSMAPKTAPAHSPSHQTVKPPSHSPVKPTPRQLFAVEGVVYCKSCNSSGVSTLVGATPLEGARVVMKCRNTAYTTKTIVVTDKNGFFYIQPPKSVTTYGVHKCRVALASPPLKTPCKKPSMLNDGLLGTVPVPQELRSKKKPSPAGHHEDFVLYKVGPFAYEPLKSNCHPKS